MLGAFTVLDVAAAAARGRARAFDALDLGVATLSPAALGPRAARAASELDERLTRDWIRRYGVDAVAGCARRGPVALAPALTIALLVGPVAAGLVGTLGPAFGVLPGLAERRPVARALARARRRARDRPLGGAQPLDRARRHRAGARRHDR